MKQTAWFFLGAFALVTLAFVLPQDRRDPTIWEYKASANQVELNIGNSSTAVRAPAFTGPVTGAVTGDVTGNVTGNISGNQSGGTISATKITGSAAVQGIKTWGTTVANPDTLVISGLGADSTASVFVKIRFQLAADTTGRPHLYVANNVKMHDTVLVYQATGAALRRYKYDWVVIY